MVKKKKAKTYSKYRSIKTEVDGIKFHSKVEAKRYIELKRQEKKGLITNLHLQPRYKIKHPTTDKLICTYVADFLYDRGEQEVIEDVKGVMTDTFKLKAKLAKFLKVQGPYGNVDDGIHITIVKSVRIARGVYGWSVDGTIEEC